MPAEGGTSDWDPSGWTVETLRAHHDQRVADIYRAMEERDLRYEQRFQAQRDALQEKDDTIQARLATLNEFRAQLGDVMAQSMPRSEAESLARANTERINENERRNAEAHAQINSRLDLTAGRGVGIDRLWGYLIGAAATVATIATIIYAFAQ